MSVTAADFEADQATGRGDLKAAAGFLAKGCAADPGNMERWLKLAAVRRGCGDLHGALVAVTEVLAIQPLAFLPLLMKAGILDALGDENTAGLLFGAALFHAPPDAELDEPIRRQLARGRMRYAAYQQATERRHAEAMAPAEARATPGEAKRLKRFRRNALRLEKVYRSEPTHFHYPGLSEQEFHDRAAFAWLEELEAATPAIVDEFLALMQMRDLAIEPYIQYSRHVPAEIWSELNHSREWSAAHLLRGGARVEPNASRCLATLAALAQVPQPDIPGRSPNAMFSILKAGAHIPPHHGISNTRLVCHLPLVIPDGCWFRVGAERRAWSLGETIVFDDTIEHEAANEGSEQRAVLIFDIWHPGLSEREQDGVAMLIAGHDVEGGVDR
jgi:aspartyl/asparaginyl beta-hydroxylase (cupin superfamily)